jgi:hypothetical protein
MTIELASVQIDIIFVNDSYIEALHLVPVFHQPPPPVAMEVTRGSIDVW